MKTKALLLLYSLVAYGHCWSQCSQSNFKSPGTVSNNTSSGSFVWSSASNAVMSDGSVASASFTLGILATVESNILVVEDFHMSIPLAVTICGIEVQIEKDADGIGVLGTSVKDQTVRLVKNGSIVGTNKATTFSWPGAETTGVYGGNGDLWGTTWTSADINDHEFGIAFSAQLNSGLTGAFLAANIDYITINVYYQHITLAPTLDFFKGSLERNVAHLQWKLQNHHEVAALAVEKLGFGNNWKAFHTLSSSEIENDNRCYDVYDQQLTSTNTYRLKITDQTGITTYSGTITIKAKETVGIDITFNNRQNSITIQSKSPIQLCRLYRSDGSIYNHRILKKLEKEVQLSIPDLRHGYLIVQVITAHQSMSKQFLLASR